MSVLEKERTASEFIRDCRYNTPQEFANGLASLSLETHSFVDPYIYTLTPQGELLSGSRLVKDTIDDKTSPLGRLEYQAVLAGEQWAVTCQEGALVWISPPKKGVYPTSKIIVWEIEYEGGVKQIFNRAIVLDFDEEQCMKFAWNLTTYSRNKPIFRNSDEIRAEPLVLETQNKSWIDILEKLIDNPRVWAMIRNGEDKQYKKEALRQAAMVQKQFFADPRLSYSAEAKRAVMQMVGKQRGSCPSRSGSKTAFQMVLENSITVGDSSGSISKDSDFCRVCPVCQEEINCIVRAGGSCPKCGAVKRCG